ncbi:MAG: septum formation initiator family protein [Spirochaetia bacterium]|jgi:hypothetical protein
MRRFLPILAGIFAAASIAILLFGDSGVLAFRNMDRYRADLAANVDALKERNAELKDQLAQLQSDEESNRIMARGINLYAAGDAVVKLEGRTFPSETYAMGDLLRMRKTDDTRNAMVKAAAVGLAFLLAAFAFIAARVPRGRAHGSHGR